MRARLLLPLLITAASPAAAQHADHGQHAGHEAPPADAQTEAHAHPAPDATTPNEEDPHAGHRARSTEDIYRPFPSPPPTEAFSGPAHAADLVFGTEAMAEARQDLQSLHGGLETSKVLIDRLEAKFGSGPDGYAWDAQLWHGGDIDKFWLKSDGEGEFGGRLDDIELQALWSHAIDPWFDLQLGLRQNLRRDGDRTHLVVGTQGLAPYWFEVETAIFLSNEGELTARLEGEYDFRITQRLILQPRAEIDLSAQDVPELGIGSGLSTAELGVRLRFEIIPEFAPYIGVEYERSFGDTRGFRRLRGEDRGGWTLLAGIRTWF